MTPPRPNERDPPAPLVIPSRLDHGRPARGHSRGMHRTAQGPTIAPDPPAGRIAAFLACLEDQSREKPLHPRPCRVPGSPGESPRWRAGRIYDRGKPHVRSKMQERPSGLLYCLKPGEAPVRGAWDGRPRRSGPPWRGAPRGAAARMEGRSADLAGARESGPNGQRGGGLDASIALSEWTYEDASQICPHNPVTRAGTHPPSIHDPPPHHSKGAKTALQSRTSYR